ncbi:DsrE family protein [Acidiplasma sp.]|uniref:DsrE family protein n=1 Tax=Acidiplasma sp. TaxID=1872114 RepID=UPI0025830620|nr:DsrE family protein [Acidiplasma sp.]
MKILFQISESEKIPLSYLAISNMAKMNDVEDIVAVYSETGIFGVLKSESENINNLLGNHKINVYACGVAMKSNNLSDADLAPGVKVAPVSFYEIAKRQKDGYIYLRL